MQAKPVYQALAGLMEARRNCVNANNIEWRDRHEESAIALVKEFMPSGSGIDSGTTLDLDKSTGDKLVFRFGYHHMDESGAYDGWTEHTLTVRASLTSEIDITISGYNRNDIKDYLYQGYDYALRLLVIQDGNGCWQEAEKVSA